jgi:ATP phosphoribosyltransferase regulatory subunit
MNFEEVILSTQEKAIFSLRQVFNQYGYRPYPKLRWEDYDFYVQHKAFLQNTPILSFHDYDGRLLALRPDVTLSLVRRYQPSGLLQKWYYEETVYRVPEGGSGFQEMLQMGIECLGPITSADEIELICMAGESLRVLNDSFLLDLSHTSLLPGLLLSLPIPEQVHGLFMKAFQKRNLTEIFSLSQEHHLDQQTIDIMLQLLGQYGSLSNGIKKLQQFSENPLLSEALNQLIPLVGEIQVQNPDLIQHLRLDSSIAPNIGYYRGLLLRGYLPNAKGPILNGGRYDPLLEKLNKPDYGFGFALTLPNCNDEEAKA